MLYTMLPIMVFHENLLFLRLWFTTDFDSAEKRSGVFSNHHVFCEASANAQVKT
jgi:hypothetical protein